MNKFFALTAAAGMLGLAACQTGAPPPRQAAIQPTGVEGTWIDGERTGLSTISGGSFRTVATDTNETLSEGRYTMTGSNAVSITGVSLARQRRGLPADVSFNCLLVTPTQLNCTSATGQQFVLTRATGLT